MYAQWIASRVPSAPTRVLDVGCGNGSLLAALGERWPGAELLGCDLSHESVGFADAARMRLWHGTVDELPVDVKADLVLSVNVVEHAEDPVALVSGLCRRVLHDGTLVVICPDGGAAGIELMFADHLFSFTAAHLHWLLGRERLHMVAADTAPPMLGAFQMAVARRGLPEPVVFADGRALAAARTAYLRRWCGLDAALSARVDRGIVCFGATEAAGLLRAYAPNAWSQVSACTFDGATRGAFGAVPIVPLESVSSRDRIVLGVRPADQPRLAERLRGRFERVVTWYDLVDA